MADRSRYIARMQFLGQQRIEIGNEVVTPEAERLFAMIVRLSTPLGRLTARQTMLDTLWPGSDETNARHNLRQTVYKAREIGLVVESGEDGLRLDPRYWSCDWEDPDGDVDGEWLIDYEPEFSDELGAWVTSQRVGVHALIRPRIVRSLQRARSAGDLIRADQYAIQLLKIDELNEEATLTRAELMAMQGAKVDALRLLDAYLNEIGRLGAGRDAALPAHLLRRRIAEKLPVVSYQDGEKHHGPLVGRVQESKRLLAGLFDARAGRGSAVMLYGREGSGKSRLLFEVKKAAILQGMMILELTIDCTPDCAPLSALRRVTSQLLDLPGALGVSPEALDSIRKWLRSRDSANDDCPLTEIEDLLAAVSEETPLVVMIDHCERIDPESLRRLDRLYRVGTPRHHALLLAASSRAITGDSDSLRWIAREPILPMSTSEVQSVISQWSAAEVPMATVDQIAYAAVFAEGNPMFGVEMLGLIRDTASPDSIPWKVKVAVDRELLQLSNFQLRILTLCSALGASARHDVLLRALNATQEQITDAISLLESAGVAYCEDGVLHASALLSEAAGAKLGTGVRRVDAKGAFTEALRNYSSSQDAGDIYASLRLMVSAQEESRAFTTLDEFAGILTRREPVDRLVFELTKLRTVSRTKQLRARLDAMVQILREGAELRVRAANQLSVERPQSMPHVPRGLVSTVHSVVNKDALATALSAAQDPTESAALRLAEASVAMGIASNLGDAEGLHSAFVAVNAVRHAPSANQFDLYRADLIYYCSFGQRSKALTAATKLAAKARSISDIQLACVGLRNAAQASSIFGEVARAQGLLHEARQLASTLGYFGQVATIDLRLADLAIDAMDITSARAYIRSASDYIVDSRVTSQVLLADVQFHSCWEAILSEDLPRAARSAKSLARQIRAGSCRTANSALLCAKLATHATRETRESHRDFQRLKESTIASTNNENVQRGLAAVLLYARTTNAMSDDLVYFVHNRLSEVRDVRGSAWPFVERLLAGVTHHQ